MPRMMTYTLLKAISRTLNHTQGIHLFYYGLRLDHLITMNPQPLHRSRVQINLFETSPGDCKESIPNADYGNFRLGYPSAK